MSTPTVRIAVDPGRSGGIACKYPGGAVVLHSMPDTESEVAMLLQSIVDASCVEGWACEAVIERVGGFVGRGQPGSSMFVFGRGVGVIIGLLLAHEISFTEVTPQRWQKIVGAGTKGGRSTAQWKRHLLDLGRKRHPRVAGLNLKTADALLLLDATEPSLSPTACAAGVSHQ